MRKRRLPKLGTVLRKLGACRRAVGWARGFGSDWRGAYAAIVDCGDQPAEGWLTFLAVFIPELRGALYLVDAIDRTNGGLDFDIRPHLGAVVPYNLFERRLLEALDLAKGEDQ